MNDTMTAPDVEHIEALDFAPDCRRPGCEHPAEWIGHARCPNCERGGWNGAGFALYCDPHKRGLDSEWTAKAWTRTCPGCWAPSAPEVLTWEPLR